VRIALYQPDIPQNTGAILRLAACLGLSVDLIEPAGFVMNDRTLRRVGMDYLDLVQLQRHQSWSAYADRRTPGQRLVLLTMRATQTHIDFDYRDDDTLLVGRESSGVPDEVHDMVDARVRIPIRADARSLNVVTALTLVAGEALRQLDEFPE
tara:strand:- start:344 stop:799 length:456 start_codon:yes stop_codon:yes gene_type:complete